MGKIVNNKASFGEPPQKRLATGLDVPVDADRTAKVRFDSPADAQKALKLDGKLLAGAPISITLDTSSKDSSKIIVSGVSRAAEWQEVKDFFGQCGQVAFADVKSGTPVVGTVRYQTFEEASQAVLEFDGKEMDGCTLEVKLRVGSTKVQVLGLPAGTEWQELKDFFKQAGEVVHADVVSNSIVNPSAKLVGEVRYDDPSDAQQALIDLNGSTLGGSEIIVTQDMTSQDGSKLIVKGIPPGVEWQELKDHFASLGQVAFADVKGAGKGKQKSVGNFMAMMNPMMMMGMNPMMMGGFGGGCGMNGGFGGISGGFGGGCAGKGGFGGGGMKGGRGKKGGGGVSRAGGGEVGKIRYDNPLHAQLAVGMLNNSMFNGTAISVRFDETSQDGTKLIVEGIPPGSEWQELKDHFASMGTVAFADVKGGAKGNGKGGAGKGKGNGKAEIRYDNPMHAQMAVAMLNGTMFNGGILTVNWDMGSQDGSKLRIGGVPAGSAWQDLKDHFAQVGNVAFANC